MEAQDGRSANDNWLLFTRNIAGGEGLEDLDLPVVMANEGQFLRLVEMAAAQASESLDLTTIEMGGLSDTKTPRRPRLSTRSPRSRKRRRGARPTMPMKGILSNPARGFYNLLHDPAKTGAAMVQDLHPCRLAARHQPATRPASAHATMSVAPHTPLGAIRDSLGVMQQRMPGYRSWDQPRSAGSRTGQVAAAAGHRRLSAGRDRPSPSG